MYIEYFGNVYKVYGTKTGIYANTAFFLIYYEDYLTSPCWKWIDARVCTPVEKEEY